MQSARRECNRGVTIRSAISCRIFSGRTFISADRHRRRLLRIGGTLLLSGGIAARIGLPITATPATNIAAFIARQSAMAAAGAQVFIGIAAIVLGILAFAGTHGQTLNLVGTLAVGAGLLMASVTSATALVGHLAH